MATPKFTQYRHFKLDYDWRYCKDAWHTKSRVKPTCARSVAGSVGAVRPISTIDGCLAVAVSTA